MSNSRSWKDNIHGGNEFSHTNRRRRGKQQQKRSRPEGRERQFPKFVDSDRINNAADGWSKKDWTCGSRNNNFNGNGAVAGPGIFPWIRKKPTNPLIIPQHTNFDAHNDYHEAYKTVNEKNESATGEKTTAPHIVGKEMNDCKSGIGSVSANNSSAPIGTLSSPAVKKFSVQVKQEKDLLVNLKQERKSSSSSSSSDSSSDEEPQPKIKQADAAKAEIIPSSRLPSSSLNIKLKQERKSSSSSSSSDSSSDEEPQPKIKQADAAKAEIIPSSRLPSSSLNIKLKPKTIPVNTPPVKSPNSEHSSSSSSSDESSNLHQTPPVQSTAKVDTEKLNVSTKGVKTKSAAKKNSSEDDVVCMGNLENKIVLEDDDDNEESIERNSNKTKKSGKKTTAENCMICDKKGHTSFECQMICKNCSAPYHGYRTCPQPANLNTMLQIFIEFCMQQFQNFNVENQIATNPYDSVPKPQVDSLHLPRKSNKSNKLKRKQIKTNEINKRSKTSKKRKISASKKTKSKSDSDDSSDDDKEEDDTDSETSSTNTEGDISDSSAESLVSSKRKQKMKSKNAAKADLNISTFSANPVNLPMVLNGFPHLTVPTASIPNTNSSTNALNTLLLTQMFQNAIGSLKK